MALTIPQEWIKSFLAENIVWTPESRRLAGFCLLFRDQDAFERFERFGIFLEVRLFGDEAPVAKFPQRGCGHRFHKGGTSLRNCTEGRLTTVLAAQDAQATAMAKFWSTGWGLGSFRCNELIASKSHVCATDCYSMCQKVENCWMVWICLNDAKTLNEFGTPWPLSLHLSCALAWLVFVKPLQMLPMMKMSGLCLLKASKRFSAPCQDLWDTSLSFI